MSICVISQPRYLPACNYLHRMSLANTFIYLDTVQYSPKFWENRNKIKTKNGPVWLSVPVIRTSREMLIKDTVIDNSQPWQRKHWESIRQTYRHAPYFKLHADFFGDLYSRRFEYLSELNHQIICYLIKQLDLRCEFRWAHEFNLDSRGPRLLIELCERVGGTVYLSGPAGREYIDAREFDGAGIAPLFHDYQHPEYPQLDGDFLPFMGGIDLLFNCGEESAKVLRSGNVSRDDVIESARRSSGTVCNRDASLGEGS